MGDALDEFDEIEQKAALALEAKIASKADPKYLRKHHPRVHPFSSSTFTKKQNRHHASCLEHPNAYGSSLPGVMLVVILRPPPPLPLSGLLLVSLRDFFDSLDEDGSGAVDEDELLDCMHAMGQVDTTP
jgi:hypothetical protein